ncbi:hypothetical protein GE061_013068 [Apolygus lucorum]|uniref:Methylcytosine dioxygenase TET n=1 Tax=Apolygus lucorum TaxID=248454 RepID=A0A8S9XUC4_APOLU|nr:hypothetical protein GE061_013068 [Apolygus lucorum]
MPGNLLRAADVQHREGFQANLVPHRSTFARLAVGAIDPRGSSASLSGKSGKRDETSEGRLILQWQAETHRQSPIVDGLFRLIFLWQPPVITRLMEKPAPALFLQVGLNAMKGTGRDSPGKTATPALLGGGSGKLRGKRRVKFSLVTVNSASTPSGGREIQERKSCGGGRKHLLYLNHDYPRGERGRGRGKGRGGARGKRSGFGTTSVAPSDFFVSDIPNIKSYRKLHQTPRSPLASPNLQLNGGSLDSNTMMSTIPDHAGVRGDAKIEPQVTQTNLPPITGAMPLYSSSVQPGMETGGFPTPLRDHRFGNSVWQPAAAPPDPNGAWTPQGQFIQQIPPQIEEIRYPQYAVSGYPQATPVVGYQQNAFMQANGNLYNGTPQPQPSPHSMHNGNSRSTPTLNGNMEYVEQSPRPSEYMNGTYPHSNQPDVMAPPTSSTPTSRCGSAHLENGEGKYTNPPTPTTPSNQGNAMPGYPLQIPPQSAQSSRNSSGYPGQVNESAERGNNGENNNAKSNDNNELWSSSPRPSESSKEDIQQLDNLQMQKSSDSWGEGRNGGSQGSAQSQNQMPHHNMQGHQGSQSLHMMQHTSNVHHHHQQMMGGQGSSPQHQEMWSGQPNSRPPSQNPPEPWPNESANQQQMWTNDKKSSQFNERAELNNRLKTMILNKQQQEIKKIQDGGHMGYQDQKNLPPVSSGNFLALGHHPRKLVSEGGGYRSGGSYRNDGLHAMENIVNSVKCPENFVYSNTPVSQPESFLQRMASSKYYQVSSQTQTSSQTFAKVSSPMPPSSRRSPSPLGVQQIKQEPQWDEKPWGSSLDPGRSPLQPIKDQAVKIETDAGCENPGTPFGDDRLKAVKEESFDSDPSKEYSFEEGDIKTEEDIKLSPEQMERLKGNVARGEVPGCECFPPDHIPAEPGPFYTHLGTAKSLEELRENVEKRTGFTGKALRIEKVLFTGKEGKTTSGCPLGKWIIRRSGPEEKVLMVVKHRKGHVCVNSWIVIVTVAWEGVPASMADDLYATVTDKLKNYGVVTSRRCGVNEPRTCACQGLDNTTCGASFSFGCSWSMYYNGCKFARSQTARKFKLSVKTEEQCMEEKLQNLATYLSPVYKTMAPESFENMTQHENEAVDCRLGLQPGRPWSGVTACFDFCAHAHRDIHNMNNGCTTVVTLTKHRGFEKPDDEQLHVLPLYVVDQTDEFGSKEGFDEKVKSGAIEVLTKYPCEIRTRQSPLESCRKLAKKRKDEREHAKRALAYKMSLSVDYPSISPQSSNEHPVQNGLHSEIQRNYLNYPTTPEKCSTPRGMSLHHQGNEMEGLTPQHRVNVYPPSPFRSPLRVVTQSPGSPYSAPATPEMSRADRDAYFNPATSPSSVFRRPVGRPPSRSSNPATPQPHMDSTYLKPHRMDSPYSQGMETDRNFYQPVPPRSPVQQPYSPGYSREHSSPLPSMNSFCTPLRDGFGSRNTAFNTYSSRSYESQSAPVSPLYSTANPQSPRSSYSAGPSGMMRASSPGSKCSSVSTQCSPSRSPYPSTMQAPSPNPSQSSGYWSGSQSDVRESFLPTASFTPPKWSPLSRHSRSTPSPSQATFSTPTTPTLVSTQQALPSFQNFSRRAVDQTDSAWSRYSPNPTMSQDHNWRPMEPNIQKNYMSSQNFSGLPSYSIEYPFEKKSSVQLEHPYATEASASPSNQWARESQTPPWNSSNQPMPRTPEVEPQNLLGSVTDFTNNEDSFSDPNVGGVAIALCHGAVLFEVAKHELHATTALKHPNRFHPTRISLVFYQHRNLNKGDHGRGEWKEKQRCKKELAEKHAEMAGRAAELAEKATSTVSIATQSLDVQTEPQSVRSVVDHMPYNFYPMQQQPPSPMNRYSPMVPTSSMQPSPTSQMQPVSTSSAWGNLFPLHPSVVQGPYQESETLG